MFLVNSRNSQFYYAQNSNSGHSFSRSYGVILPSSLERVISRPLVFSTCPPVSVSGTGTISSSQQTLFLALALPHRVLRLLPIHSGRGYFSCVPLVTPIQQSGNIHPVSIDYAFRPRLRSRLTLRGRAFRRNPWAFGVYDSHIYFRYLSRHSHFCTVHICLPLMLLPIQNAPLPLTVNCKSTASVTYLAPFIFGAGALDQWAITHSFQDCCF